MTVERFRWSEMEKEPVTETIWRKVITGDQAMVAQIFLNKGSVVPRHAHHNEQFSYVQEGALRFWIGEDKETEIDVVAGEVLRLPSNVAHKVQALEDSLSLDIFSPPRQDWLDGTDSYFRETE